MVAAALPPHKRLDDHGSLPLRQTQPIQPLGRQTQPLQPLGGHGGGLVQKTPGRPSDVYEPVQRLGEGAFGVAHLVRNKRTGQQRVLKTICKRRSQVPLEQLEREIQGLKACDHPHIVRLFEYFEDYENVYLIMERCTGGELLKIIQEQHRKGFNFSEEWTSTVIRQCLEAVAYIHAQGIIHKDLKSENILLLHEATTTEAIHAVIIDLGIAELFKPALGRKGRCTVVAGTPTHMAPEVWQGSFGPVADVWSLGVVLFEMFTGRLPFAWSKTGGSQSAQEWLRLAQKGPDWGVLSHCSNEAQALCQRMLISDDRMRPTAQQCLRHAWFTLEARPREQQRLSEVQVSAMGDYERRSNWEKMILLQVTSQLHVSQIGGIHDLFRQADRDKNGTISVQDLMQVLTQLGMDPKHAEAAAIGLDVDSRRVVEYTELVTGIISMLGDSLRSMLWQGFCLFDVNGNGTLGREEVRSVMSRMDFDKMGFRGIQVDTVLRSLDPNGNGVVSFEEFWSYFMKYNVRKATESQNSPPTKPVYADEDFALLLDQIEAENARGASAGTAAPQSHPSDWQVPEHRREEKDPFENSFFGESLGIEGFGATGSKGFSDPTFRSSPADSNGFEENADEKLTRMLDDIMSQ